MLLLPDVPTLEALQNYKRNLNRSPNSAVVTNMLDLNTITSAMTLPSSVDNLFAGGSNGLSTVNSTMFYIPQDGLVTYGVNGACLTGATQIKWIGQLAKLEDKFTLHADGKHKLHHGGWLLITLGTHHLRYVHLHYLKT